jgi:site-specific DNA-methyltransferase (adenine-specific)
VKAYYESDGITIYHGDCREILPALEPIDLVVTDPPYGAAIDANYHRFSGGVARQHKYSAVAGDKERFDPAPWIQYPYVILWGANCYSDRLPMGIWLVWDKRFANGSSFLADAEVAWMKGGDGGKAGGSGVYIYSQTWMGFVRNEPRHGHPTQKPVALMRWCISKSKAAGAILDPFMGSGTTLRAAKDLGRRAIGIEIEEKYCEIAAKRLSQNVFDFSEEAAC